VRESPALDIIELLRNKGADVRYHDPYISCVTTHSGKPMNGQPELDTALAEADCVMIVTDHSVYDWQDVTRRAPCLVDTRHVALS
jgi:UDP-N-acetyl-D-glucosamine dehydrogenase